ncbi:MAG: S8 family serine peptidase [Bacteroidales bacterium]
MKKIPVVFICLFYATNIMAQVAPDNYRIFFTDKNNSEYSINHPEKFLSQQAINRRLLQNIEIKENDLPVNSIYLDSLKSLGLKISNTSKWLNSAVVFTTDQLLMDTINKLSFVKSSQKTGFNKPTNKSKKHNCRTNTYQFKGDSTFDYGYATTQIAMLNGHVLHRNGNLGQSKTIAVLDAGFFNVDKLPAFDSLWKNNQILGTYDFVDDDTEVFDASSHGMKVLSVMGGNIPGELIGTAPKANYWLLRTEETASEFSIEEDNWVAAAEFADSVGADIINTSLGYFEFDDPLLNYIYQDMNGNTAFITKAADIAASKGMLVVASAGNQGDDPWKYITAPADGDSVLTVGSVNQYAEYSYFSSIGPTADGRIKPNVAAIGYQAAIQGIDGSVTASNGTSFSAPLISGLAACLWQYYPDMNNIEILKKIEESAHQYSTPDNFTGYGIPDFGKAAELIHSNLPSFVHYIPGINIYPNPFYNELHIEIDLDEENIVLIEIYSITGNQIKQLKPENHNNSKINITISGLNDIPSGIYLLKIHLDNYSISKRISKI